MGRPMIHEVFLLRANHVTQELEALAYVERCSTREEAEALAGELNTSEDLDKDEFFFAIEREDEEDEDE